MKKLFDNQEVIIEDLSNSSGIIPCVPEGKRIIPNDLIRSSLFTVTNHNIKREYIKERELYTFGETQITYTGEELRQDDEDIWLQIIYLFSKTKEQFIEFLPYSILRFLGWPGRTQYCSKLKECINRMSATNIIIVNKSLGAGITLSLIRKFIWKEEDGSKLKKWKVWLEPEIIKLFGDMCYSKILWEQRKKLNPLAKWLHAYYSSHAEPFPLKIKTIHSASGSKTKEMKHFKPVLKSALTELFTIGFLDDFWIAPNDLVYITRKKTKNYIGNIEHDQ